MSCGNVIFEYFQKRIKQNVNNDVFVGPQTDCLIDIIFVLDSSGSIGSQDFEQMTAFVSKVVGGLFIGNYSARIGLVTFSTAVGESFNLNDYSTVGSIKSAISSLTYTGGGTQTHLALEHVRATMLTSAAGDRSNVPNSVVVFTDGRSNDATATKVSTP